MKRNLIFAVAALVIGALAGGLVWFVGYFYPRQYVKDESGEYVNIETAKSQSTFPVSKNTMFEIEYYYPDENRTLTENAGNIPALLGCDKDGVTKYLKEYMEHLTQKEKEEGLVSYEMTSYQKNKIYLRKTYKEQVRPGFFAKSFNGFVVILNGDEKTVYEYTQIALDDLPDTLKEQILNGYYLETEEELYSFLENYSS